MGGVRIPSWSGTLQEDYPVPPPPPCALLPCHILSQCQSHPRLAHIHSLLVSFSFVDSVLVLVPQPSQTTDFQFLLRSQCPQCGLRSPQRDCSRQPVKEGKSEIKKSWQIAQRSIAAKKRREENARVSNCGIYAIAWSTLVAASLANWRHKEEE